MLNKCIGGVDLHDQFRTKYNIGCCGKKLWRYIFWFILNCCIVNAGFCIRKQLKCKVKINEPSRELLTDLIGGFSKKHHAVVDQLQPPGVADGNQALH
ncbi:LOW QUALITY PROTEIN: hypothetical protein MAR_019961, partial [Mya arenaria]